MTAAGKGGPTPSAVRAAGAVRELTAAPAPVDLQPHDLAAWLADQLGALSCLAGELAAEIERQADDAQRALAARQTPVPHGDTTTASPVLAPLTHAELLSLRARMETVRSDYLTQQARGWTGLDAAGVAAWEAAWAVATDLLCDLAQCAPAAIEADRLLRLADAGLSGGAR